VTRPITDPTRLAALDAFRILDTPRETAFDDIARLARDICGTAAAAINLVAEDRQWFKAEEGLGLRETGLAGSICAHTLMGEGMLVVPDALADARFAASPLLGSPPLRFYAGAVLETAEGLRIGTVCVLDQAPRPQGLTEAQSFALGALARQVMTQLGLRRAQMAAAASERTFRAIIEAMPQLVWSARPDGFLDYFNHRWLDFTGTPRGEAEGDAWMACLHPEDLARAQAEWQAALRSGEPYDSEYRLRGRDGSWRWFIARASPIRDPEQRIERWFGTCTDVDDLKQAQESRELLARELNHRMRNIFTLISGLVSITSRGVEASSDFAEALRVRIRALARAHEFVTPLTAAEATQGELGGLLEVLLAPYRSRKGITIDVPTLRVGARAATALALILHEQATNALKYGGLSVPEGQVAVSARIRADELVLVWRETGGPPIPGPPTRSGFGTLLASRSAQGALGGEMARDWRPEGLTVTLTLPVAGLAL